MMPVTTETRTLNFAISDSSTTVREHSHGHYSSSKAFSPGVEQIRGWEFFMPQEYVWSGQHGLYLPLKFVGQAPHQSVENVVGQQPQAKVGNHHLHHPRMSLRETLSLLLELVFEARSDAGTRAILFLLK